MESSCTAAGHFDAGCFLVFFLNLEKICFDNDYYFFWTHGAQRNKRKFGCWVVVLFFQQVFKTLEISRKFWFFLTWLFF